LPWAPHRVPRCGGGGERGIGGEGARGVVDRRGCVCWRESLSVACASGLVSGGGALLVVVGKKVSPFQGYGGWWQASGGSGRPVWGDLAPPAKQCRPAGPREGRVPGSRRTGHRAGQRAEHRTGRRVTHRTIHRTVIALVIAQVTALFNAPLTAPVGRRFFRPRRCRGGG